MVFIIQYCNNDDEGEEEAGNPSMYLLEVFKVGWI